MSADTPHADNRWQDTNLAELLDTAKSLSIQTEECGCPDETHQNALHDFAHDAARILSTLQQCAALTARLSEPDVVEAAAALERVRALEVALWNEEAYDYDCNTRIALRLGDALNPGDAS